MTDDPTHMRCDHAIPICDTCAVVSVWSAAHHGSGLIATDPQLRAQVGQLVRMWNARLAADKLAAEQARQQASLLTIGCPYCGAFAGHWCVTLTTGKPYDDRYGTAQFHADRKRALAALDTPDAEVIQLRPRQGEPAP